jgi:hypothetical protein
MSTILGYAIGYFVLSLTFTICWATFNYGKE